MKTIPLRAILQAVCDEYWVTYSEVCGKNRMPDVLRAREIYCGMARLLTAKSYPEIARTLNTAHSSVMTQHKRFLAYSKRERAEVMQRIGARLGLRPEVTPGVMKSVLIEAREILRMNSHAAKKNKQRVIENLEAVILGKYPPHEVAA